MLNGVKSECKLFADDNSLFSVAHDVKTSASVISKELKLISEWSFNPDPSKQAQEIIFSRKKRSHLTQGCISIIFRLVQLHCTNILEYYLMIS